MEIERLDLIRWGKFSGHTIRLKSGVNIIYGGNESGKSTIHSFLGAMLSGTPRKAEKGRLASDTFLTGGDGEGAMTIWDGGQRYELHRTFAPAPGILSVRQETEGAEDLNSWEELDEPQEMLSDLLGGLDAETFESTVFWKQNQTAWDLYVEDGLKHCLKASKTGESVDGVQALQVLEERRGKAEQKKKKEEDALEERIRKRQTEAEYVRSGSRTAAGTVQCAARWSAEGRGGRGLGERGIYRNREKSDPDASAAGWCTRAAGSTFAAESHPACFPWNFRRSIFTAVFPGQAFSAGRKCRWRNGRVRSFAQGRATEGGNPKKRGYLSKASGRTGAALPSAYEDGDGRYGNCSLKSCDRSDPGAVRGRKRRSGRRNQRACI